jgi:trigger factor
VELKNLQPDGTIGEPEADAAAATDETTDETTEDGAEEGDEAAEDTAR